ncbi:MAG: AraC family transcriptional regulator [Colwellia sp.]|nr:AraC family transcriptional regulator [Colwellia sp.]MCW8863302.1 AraC family transcriptional regulator [Colwellia sp.]
MPQIPEVYFKTPNLPDVGFEIIELESLYSRYEAGHLPIASDPHRVSFHNLLFITGGVGEHFVDFHKFPVEKGSVVFINQGQVHTFDVKNKPSGKLIVFTDSYIQKVASTVGIQIFPPTHFMTSALPSFKLETNTEEQLSQLVPVIEAEYLSKGANVSYLQALFAAFLIKVSEARPDIYHTDMTQYQIELFNHFVVVLEENFTKSRDAHYYAEQVATTYKTLNKTCKLATNKTAKQLIDAHTILEAKRRLTVEKIQVQQLSDSLGFDEASNFVKYFKKHTLLTPNQFRKNN